jgi:hypothetical protein
VIKLFACFFMEGLVRSRACHERRTNEGKIGDPDSY